MKNNIERGIMEDERRSFEQQIAKMNKDGISRTLAVLLPGTPA